MLNIQPAGFIQQFSFLNSNKNNSLSPKLKPLEYDTFSFTGARTLNHTLQNAFDNVETCEDISKNAKKVETDLKKVLNKKLQDLVANTNNPDGIIEPVSTRTKSGPSIREKATSIFEEAIVDHDINNFINLNKTDDIKSVVNDVVGARVILKQLDTKKNAQIIDRLIELVKEGKLNIEKISYIVPDEDNLPQYFEDRDIERLEKAVNERRNNSKEITAKKVPSKSGYTAVHIDVDLSDENLIAKNNGYKGEIQILGRDVAQLKDLEDYCYKIKQDKDIKCDDPAYGAFVAHMNKYFKYKNNQISDDECKKISDNYKSLFDEYTYRAYVIQRQKTANSEDYDKDHLPSLKECDMEGKLPADLDFNYLQKIRKHCDSIFDLCMKKAA